MVNTKHELPLHMNLLNTWRQGDGEEAAHNSCAEISSRRRQDGGQRVVHDIHGDRTETERAATVNPLWSFWVSPLRTPYPCPQWEAKGEVFQVEGG